MHHFPCRRPQIPLRNVTRNMARRTKELPSIQTTNPVEHLFIPKWSKTNVPIPTTTWHAYCPCPERLSCPETIVFGSMEVIRTTLGYCWADHCLAVTSIPNWSLHPTIGESSCSGKDRKNSQGKKVGWKEIYLAWLRVPISKIKQWDSFHILMCNLCHS